MGGGIQHLKECAFLPVMCPLKCVESDGERRGEVVRVERRQLAEHELEFCSQRELKCEFCGGAVRACDMNPHLGECEEFPVDCPNGCEAAGETGTRQIERGAVPLHLSECPLQRMECLYREYGCGEEMERRQLDLHEREYMHTHFRLAMKEMKRKHIESTELKDAQILQANKIDCLEKLSAVKDSEILSVNKEIKEMETLSFEMKQKQTESNKLKDSQILQANKIDCLEKLSAIKDSEILSVNKEIKELKTLSIEMKQKQTESNKLKDSQILQTNNKINCLETLNKNKDLEIISVKKELKTLSIEMKQKQTESNEKIQFLQKQNALLTEALSSTLVSTGQLEWKIRGVKQKIEKKEDTYSDPFYVGLYKCQGNIVWDCSKTGKVGCFICIMRGEFDDKLKWPFIFRRKFVLLNQNRNEDNYIHSSEITQETLQKYPECLQKPTEIRNIGFGTGAFMSKAEILSEKYCEEDYICLHLTVEQLLTF